MKEPPHTCPLIDEAQRIGKMILSSIKNEDTDRDHAEYLLDTLKDQLEEIRSANEKLREWGQWQEERCEELQDEIYALEDRLEISK